MKLSTFVLLAPLAAGCSGAVENSGTAESAAVGGCTVGATAACALDDGGSAGDTVAVKTCEAAGSGGVWSACSPAACTGAEVACTTASGQSGVAKCVDGQAASACGVVGSCHPGDTLPTPNYCNYAVSCILGGGSWDYPGCGTPLVLSFSGQPVAFTQAAGDFDLFGQEATVATRWVSAATPWLVLDRDGDGAIDDGRELFGSMTARGDGSRAPNGFAALAELDDDGDGAITPRDPAFVRLALWRDADQDRRSDPRELTTLRDEGIVAIELGYRTDRRCIDGDCEVERAGFVYRDARGVEHRGEVVDVHLAPLLRDGR
jgi:hypothetical protein